ncbi:MAG TPA: hypothetical protein VK279_14030 [Solirubrobacteraceae bacterium]|nr:hypothetical protein [Solirubrobacteraceae bacterium]
MKNRFTEPPSVAVTEMRKTSVDLALGVAADHDVPVVGDRAANRGGAGVAVLALRAAEAGRLDVAPALAARHLADLQSRVELYWQVSG